MTEEEKKPFSELPSSGMWEDRDDLDDGYWVEGHDDFVIYCGDASYYQIKEIE